MQAELNLTEEQKTALAEIQKASDEKRRDTFRNAFPNNNRNGGGQGGPSFAGCGSPPVGSPGVAGLALGTLVNGLYVPASGGDGVAGKNGGAGGPGAGGSGGPSCCVMQAAGLNLAPAGNSCAPAGPGSGGSPATNDGVTSATGLLGSSGNLLTLP